MKIKKWLDILSFTSKVCFCAFFLCIITYALTTPIWIWFVVEDKLFAAMLAVAVGSADLGIILGSIRVFLDWWIHKTTEEDDYYDL